MRFGHRPVGRGFQNFSHAEIFLILSNGHGFSKILNAARAHLWKKQSHDFFPPCSHNFWIPWNLWHHQCQRRSPLTSHMWTISNSKQTMSSNRKHNVETPSGSGPSSNKPASSEQWKEFWAHAKSQKRRKKTLTREESRRRRQKKMDQNIRRNVIQRMKQNKPVIHLLNDPKVARLLTEADFCLWDSQT